jgi:hypothetical protein
LALLLATVFLVSGCFGGIGGSPSNVVLTIANGSSEPATVLWARPGLLGTPLFPDTGTDTVAGCNVYLNSFGAGDNEVSIKLGDQSLDLVFDATSRDQIARYVAIDPNGAISEVDERSLPTAGCGASS